MKNSYSKITFAAIFAAVLSTAMCGCDLQQTASRPTSGSFLNNLPNEPDSSDKHGSSGAPAEKIITISEDLTVAPEETLVVKNGAELYITDGAVLTVDGTLECENGGVIKVQADSKLLLNNMIELQGELLLGGFLGIREDGVISGSGVLSVLNTFEDIDCEGECTARIKAPEVRNTDGCTTVGGVLIANKKYTLPEDYGDGLTDETYDALLQMREDSGYTMEIVSGFRSYADQEIIFANWCDIDGYEKAKMYSSEPGHSEHQTGLTMDITHTEEDYADTEEGEWLAENCHKYGFIIRYPKDMEHITGYTFEPWHIRYLGRSTAKLVHDSGLTLEEFLGVEGM